MADGTGKAGLPGAGEAAGIQGDLWGEVAIPDGSGSVDGEGEGGSRNDCNDPGYVCRIALCGCRFIRTGKW